VSLYTHFANLGHVLRYQGEGCMKLRRDAVVGKDCVRGKGIARIDLIERDYEF